MTTGSLTLSEQDVACTWELFKLKGKKHGSLWRPVTVDVMLGELEVIKEGDRLRANEEQLPSVCSARAEGCVFEGGTIILAERVVTCGKP